MENPFEATADRRGVKNLDLETKSLLKAVEAEAIFDSKKKLENQNLFSDKILVLQMAENKYEFQGSLLLEKKVKRVTHILTKSLGS